MTDKQFINRISRLNSELWNAIGEAEELLNTEQAKKIKNTSDETELIELRNLYNAIDSEASANIDLNETTLSDISYICERLYQK